MTISRLKKKVWKVFSQYIRKRNADKNGYTYCVTCKRKKFWKELQAGHFIPGRHNIILFDERLVHPQCYHCNCFLFGNPREYDKFMRKKYGDEKVAEFDKLGKYRGNIKQFTVEELNKLYDNYSKKLKQL